MTNTTLERAFEIACKTRADNVEFHGEDIMASVDLDSLTLSMGHDLVEFVGFIMTAYPTAIIKTQSTGRRGKRVRHSVTFQILEA